MAVDFTTLCTEIGSVLAMQQAIITANGTTIPAHVATIQTEYSGAPADLLASVAPIPAIVAPLQSGTLGAQQTLSTAVLQTIYNTLNDVAPLPGSDVGTVMNAFSQQFAAASQSFAACTVSVAPAIGGSNVGNAVICASMLRGDGLAQQNALAELISGTATATNQITLIGETAVQSGLSPTWPGGSGVNIALTCNDARTAGLLNNGEFDTFTVANTPDGWIITSGTPGTNIYASVYTQQTLTITSTSSSGSYVIAVEDLNSVIQYTAPLAYNATASQVQAAIAALPGFSGVTVTSTGTTPDFTHTIVFNGIAGDVPVVSIPAGLNTTGLTITPAGTVSGSAGFVNLALKLVSTGSEAQTLYQAVGLQPNTVYCLQFWAKVNSTPAAGNLRLGLTSGIGTTYLQNGQAVNQYTDFGHAGFTSSWKSFSCFFQTPAVLPSRVYFKLFVSTATTTGTTLWLDQMTLIAAQQLYPGGPYAAAFAGNEPLTIANLTTVADTFTLTVANDYGGAFVTLFNRNFNLAGLGIVLATSGSPTQADALIA